MVKITIDYGSEDKNIEFNIDDATWTWDRPMETAFNLDGSVKEIIPGKIVNIVISGTHEIKSEELDPLDV